MHHDTITGTSRTNVIQHAINQAEGIMNSNSQMYQQQLSKLAAELNGMQVKDIMIHLVPKWDKGRYAVTIDVQSDTLITVVNPGLDWLDTVSL